MTNQMQEMCQQPSIIHFAFFVHMVELLIGDILHIGPMIGGIANKPIFRKAYIGSFPSCTYCVICVQLQDTTMHIHVTSSF